MAYEPKTWVCGETITAEALNHIEQGIASGGTEPLILTTHIEQDETQVCSVLDKTFQEVEDAFSSGRAVILHSTDEPSGYVSVINVLTSQSSEGTAYVVVLQSFNASTGQMDVLFLSTDDANGYPRFCMGAG